MKNKAWFISFILILALSACSLPTQAVETPTVEETSIAHSTEAIATETEVAAETAVATETPELPLPIVYGTGEELVILDPATGVEVSRITAPGFGFGWNAFVTGNGVFYVDNNYQNAYRVGFDGAVQELTFLNPDGGYFIGEILPSSDGQKIAHGAIPSYAPEGMQALLKVFNVDGSGEQVLVDQMLEIPLRPTPIKWSVDGEAVYYMNVVEGIEGYGGRDLYKVELGTNLTEGIFPNADGLVSTSVSPNETYAARAVISDPPSITIRDLVNGTNQTVTLPEKQPQVWQMVWAPDESALLVTVGQGLWTEDDVYSIIRIDLTTLALSYLIEDNVALLRAVAWQVPETIWLMDATSTLWMMNAADQTLSRVASDVSFIAISQ